MTKSQSTLFIEIEKTIEQLKFEEISAARKAMLQPLIKFIQSKVNEQKEIKLNLICTHNSRRSHLAQVWAQTAAAYFNLKNVFCYSGGTQVTALFYMVIKTLVRQGFQVNAISDGCNPNYAINYSQNEPPIIGFSKKYNDAFNPQSEFAAVLTCSQADTDCPLVIGAEKRISLSFEDPKAHDHTTQQSQKYHETSLQIATEMWYVFSQIKQ